MDDNETLFLILLALMFGGIIGVIYYGQSLIPPPPYQELELYRDVDAEERLSGNVIGWTNIEDFGINSSKLVYIKNPNNFDVTIDLFWETVPNAMAPFCRWSSTLEDGSAITPGITECYLYCLIEHNEYFYNHGEVITQIKVREQQ